MCCSGDLDGREVNIQVPPKGSDKGGGVVDLNIPNQLANEVFRYAANAKGKQTGQLDNWTNRMTDRQTEGEICRQSEGETYRHTDKYIER